MNPEQLLAHLKRLTATLSPRQLATLGGVFVGVVGVVVGSAYWINAPTYGLLLSDMDAESAASVVSKLKADKVSYQLDDGGRSIRVPTDKIDELRLEFASQGMPASGRIGFEIFDRTAFGTTEFLEHVNYRRALEGELARTIATIGDVASARVHIAMAKDSLFTTESQPAKASVVLKLRNSRPLAPATVAGITNLVAASVESLRPESVVVLDTFGRPLTRTQDDDDGGGLQLDKQRRVEHDLSAKVVSLLEPIVGEGRVRVNVSARLDADSEEETEERWDPTTVVRSKQTSTDTGATLLAGGIAGARANAPPNTSTAATQAPVPAAAPQGASHMSETTNYEVSKVTRHKIVPRGQLARLSVAVILDDDHVTTRGPKGEIQISDKPRSPQDLQRIQHLVASSVGVDPARGDEVTVENIAFNDAPVEDAAPAGNWWQRTSPQLMKVGTAGVAELGRLLAILLIGTLGFTMILRPMMRRALNLPPAVELAPGQLPTHPPKQVKTIADLEGEIEAEIDAGLAAKASDSRRVPVLSRKIAKVVEQEPEHVARLVRGWMTDEER